VSRCGCGLSDFSISRDRGGATLQGCRNRTSGVGGDGADPASRTCAGSRPRAKSAAIVEIHRHVSPPAADHESRCGVVGKHIPPHLRDCSRRGRKLSVGFGELIRDTIVSLATCDLCNASREAESTELFNGAKLSARNIFLSGAMRSRPVPS
jgi:hypothetical protein